MFDDLHDNAGSNSHIGSDIAGNGDDDNAF